MESQITTTIVSGIFSLVSTFGTIYLKDYLDKRKTTSTTSVTGDTTISKSIPGPNASSTANLSQYSSSRPLIILLIAFGIGMLSRRLEPIINGPDIHLGTLFTFVLLAVVSLVFLAQRSRHKVHFTELFFQLENISLWSGFVFGWSIANGNFWSDMFGMTVAWWLICAIIGGIILRILVSRAKK